MPATSANLVDTLRRLRLLEPQQLDEVTATLLGRIAQPKALAAELLKRDWLTPFQANLLLQGRGQELVLGSYLLLERLGQGGMGKVFKARHRRLGRIVALKVMRKERLSNPAAVRRFRREVRAAAQLTHPNVVLAYDADEVGGIHLLVMECVEGATDLARLVKTQGPLPVAQAVDFIRQAALGLQHAHERGLVHRDIKPHNLLLAADGKTIKILDMGLARLDCTTVEDEASSTMTQEGMVMGTPDYIAPEQALSSHSADIRADIYSLGCTLYHLLTGRVPFAGGSLTEKLLRHQFEDPRPVEAFRADVPLDVAALVRRMMAKKPQDRYETPAELAVELAAVLRTGGLPSGQAGVPRLTDPAAVSSAQEDTVESAFNYMARGGQTEPLTERRKAPARRGPGGWLWLAPAAAVLLLLTLAGMVVLRLGTGNADRAMPADTGPARAEVEKQITNSIGMKLVLIPAGTFTMGSPDTEAGRRPNEGPLHAVQISRPFYMGIFEVTQQQYEKVTGANPSAFRQGNKGGPDHPVEMVTWDEAVAFCNKLSALAPEKAASRLYRLPTEAEWEYACRAGSRTAFGFGDDPKQLGHYGWFADNDGGSTHPVGQLRPNAWGLYDMHGNVWELCADSYDASYYRSSPVKDPQGPPPGSYRVLRGGAIQNPWSEARSANRWPDWPPGSRMNRVGFRAACDLLRGTVISSGSAPT